jgi:tetratricopeptide (TPR) repeat protein
MTPTSLRTIPLPLLLVLLVPAAIAHAQPPSNAPVYQLTGRVVMDDGSQVPLSTSIEFVCNGQAKKRVKPYSNGDFSLTIGEDSTEMPDVTLPRDAFGGQRIPFDSRTNTPTGNDGGRFEVSGCEIRAVLPGFTSSVIALEPRRRLDHPDIGILLLRKSDSIGAPSAIRVPERAGKMYDNARRLLDRPQPDYAAASIELQKAVTEFPRFAAAWNLIGRTRVALKETDGARDAFNKSIAADPKFVEPYIHLARLEAQQVHWDEAINLTGRALKLNPALPEAHYLRALGHFQLGEFEPAEQAALEVQKMAGAAGISQFPITLYILGATEARKGKFESAEAYLKEFLATNPDQETADGVRKILADWAAVDAAKK